MKLSVLLLFSGIIVNQIAAQINLPVYNQEQASINKKAFIVLGSWSVANIITGLAGKSNSNEQTRYFHQMNFIWGSVNLLIAGSGYISAKRRATDLSLVTSIKQQNAIEKTFLFNAGLDLAYIATGAYCIERGKNQNTPYKLKGYGNSILVQGGALLLFDAFMYATHLQHGKKIWKVLNGLQSGPGSLGLSLSLK